MAEVVEVLVTRADGIQTGWCVRPGNANVLDQGISDMNDTAGMDRCLADAEYLRRVGFVVNPDA